VIYFLYNVEDKKPYIKEIGDCSGILVGCIEEHLLPYIIMPTCLIVPEKVALAWKFANKYKEEISVREGTPSYEQLDKSSLTLIPDGPRGPKYKYYLTEEDKQNALLINQALMYFMLDKYYYNKIKISNSTPKIFNSQESEHELMKKKAAIVTEINACQNWLESGILLSKRFGIMLNPEDSTYKIDL
jgi:hypothetical protein